MPTTEQAGAWNLKVGRLPKVVATEVLRLLRQFDLDWLCVCEAAGYIDTMRRVLEPNGYVVLTGEAFGAARDSAVIVRKGLAHKPASVHSLGGIRWERRPGRPGLHWARKMASALIGDTRVGAVHLPPGPFGPRFPLRRRANRRSLRRLRRITRRWMSNGRSWVLAGDWNRHKFEEGTLLRPSPKWLARQTGAHIVGDGIDYVMAKGCRISDYQRVTFGGSDHRPVLFTVSR